jgi:hypothetical protein
MDEGRKYESHDDYHGAYIYDGDRQYRFSAYDFGSELFRALAYCSERAEYWGGAQRAPLIVGVASEHCCSCAAALSWLKANRPNVQELEETHQDLT